MPAAFVERFEEACTRFGPLVWGLDPARSLLERWGLPDSADGLEGFVDVVLEAAVGTVGLVKPQSAFYERHGWQGVRALSRLIREARQAGLLVVVDVKRGDVGTTNDAYADAYLGPDAPLGGDAMTVHPYLGLAAMGSLVTRAEQSGACLLVVTRSSNAEGRPLQSARHLDGRSVEATLLAEIGAWNEKLAPGSLGPVGAVVGATQLDPGLDLVAANALFLAPGIGAQGAGAEDVERTFASCLDRVMPSASRALLSSPDVGELRDRAAAMATEFRGLRDASLRSGPRREPQRPLR